MRFTPLRFAPLRQRARWIAAGLAGVLMLALLGSLADAETVKLTDGTVLEGEIKKIGSTYQIVTEDGQYKFVPESKVESIGGAAPTTGAPVADVNATGTTAGYSREYEETRSRADRCEEPARAVALWDSFLSRKGLSDLEKQAAEKERSRWNKLYTSGAEKVKGKWIGGEELQTLKDEANDLVEAAMEMEDSGQVVDALTNYRKAVILYPNSFRAHYNLAYIKYKEGVGQQGGNRSLKEAERHLRAALRLEPELPAVHSSCGAVMFALGKYEEGIEHMWTAVKKAETEMTVGNLLTALSIVPNQWLRNNRTLRDINLNANYLREKYNGGRGLFFFEDYTHGVEDLNPEDDDVDQGPPGLQGNGSGFFITPDGYLLTNKHVAETDDGYYYRVRLDSKDEEGNYREYNARFVAADSEFDIALLKVDLPEGETVPYLDLLDKGEEDPYPGVASQVMVLGYPVTGLSGPDSKRMQVAIGTVKSINPDEEREVWFDLSTTFGNSGGPIVDRNGDLVAILTGALTVHNVVYVQGVSVKQINEFFERIGDKSPTFDGLARDIDRPFHGETLAREASPATLLVLIFRGNLDDASEDAGTGGGDGDEEENGEEAADATPSPALPGARQPAAMQP